MHKQRFPTPCDSSEDSCSSTYYLSVNEVQEEVSCRACRVCWDSSDTDKLVAPCSCKGTQKYVHVKCLRRWQENVQKRDLRDERAYRCSVCRAPYSLAPPDPRWSTRLWQILRGLGGAACVSLLAFGLAGPPWPHLALLALVLLSTRSHGLLAVALLAAGTLLAALHVRGLRLMMRFDEAGRVGVAVVRHGAPVQGLGPGTLLVASDDLDHSLFRRSVVLIYEHGEGRGAKGVILNQPMGSPPEYVAGGGPDGADGGFNLTESVGRRGPAPKHFLGGPVGMPGEGIRQELAVLHTIGGVDGATVVLPPAGGRPELFQGGRLADVLELSEAGARGRRVGAPSRDQRVLVFHGISTWAEGQLEGEIRAGAWAYGSACHEDILHADPDQLWGVLLGSSRVTWLG